MILGKKFVVQKSFRLDASLEADLEYLSEELNRPQNDLVNLALEQFMYENKMWFVKKILVEQCEGYFDRGEESVHCEVGGITIDIHLNQEDLSTIVDYCYKDDDGTILDESTTVYPDSPNLTENVSKELEQIAITHLSSKPEIVEPYLKQRLNYR